MPNDALADSILAALRERLPEWNGADDARFAEIVVPHRAASLLARQQLAEPVLRSLLAAGQTDEVASRFIEVGKATDLLFGSGFASGNLELLHHPSTRAASAAALVDLLYGEGDVAERVQSLADQFPGSKPAANWPIATYFLWLVRPDTEIYVKPTDVDALLDLAGAPFDRGPLNGADYARIRVFAHDVRDALADYGVETMIDVQAVAQLVAQADEGEAAGDAPASGQSAFAKAEQYLGQFAERADAWFEANAGFSAYHAFFQHFFAPDHLAQLTWPDVQKVGQHLHAMQSNALARTRAFGNANHEMDYYREAFGYFARGNDPLAERLNRLRSSDSPIRLKYMGDSSLGEIAGQLFAADYSLLNERSRWAMGFLDLPAVKPKDTSLGHRFTAFSASVAPLVPLYERIVGRRTDWPVRLEVDQFFSWLYETQRLTEPPAVEVEEGTQTVWLIAPGAGGANWSECYDAGEITIGWGEVGDVRSFADLDALTDKMADLYSSDARPINRALACWEFAHAIRVGDVLIAKKGRHTLLGAGYVTSDYRFEAERDAHPHVRSVDWLVTGEWSAGAWSDTYNTGETDRIGSDRMLPTKTLTGISKYPDMVAELLQLVGLGPDAGRRSASSGTGGSTSAPASGASRLRRRRAHRALHGSERGRQQSAEVRPLPGGPARATSWSGTSRLPSSGSSGCVRSRAASTRRTTGSRPSKSRRRPTVGTARRGRSFRPSPAWRTPSRSGATRAACSSSRRPSTTRSSSSISGPAPSPRTGAALHRRGRRPRGVRRA